MVVHLVAHKAHVGGQFRSRGATTNAERSRLHAYFIPRISIDERLQRACSALHDERLALLLVQPFEQLRNDWLREVQTLEGRLTAVDHYAARCLARPVAHVEARLFTFVGDASHEDGIVLGAQFVNKRLCERCGYGARHAVVVEKGVGGLRPLQYDVRSALFVERDEAAVQFATFLFEHTHRHLDAGIAQLLYATTLHGCERVDAAHDAAAYTFPYNKVGAWRRLAVVGAWLQTDVYRSFAEQPLVLGAHRCERVHLGMSFAAAHVVAFADDASVGSHYNSTHHGVGLSILSSVGSELKAAAHVKLVHN